MVYLQEFDSYTAEHQSFMTTVSLDGTILSASEGLYDSLGYEQAEVSGTNLIEYINPKLHNAVGFWMESMSQDQGDKNPYTSIIIPLIGKDEKEHIFSLLVRPTNLSGKDFYLIVAEAGLDSADAHDKKVISKLAKKSRKQREGWDFIINTNGLIIEATRKSSLGYEKNEILNESLLDLIESDQKKLIEKLKVQESFVLPLKLKTKQGEPKSYAACFVPDFLADSTSPAFIVILRSQEV
jgi:PAS domain S-box-containing protein